MSELDEMGKADDLTDTGFLLQIAKGWGFKDREFNHDNVAEFFDNYPGQLKFLLPIAKRS